MDTHLANTEFLLSVLDTSAGVRADYERLLKKSVDEYVSMCAVMRWHCRRICAEAIWSLQARVPVHVYGQEPQAEMRRRTCWYHSYRLIRSETVVSMACISFP